MENEISNKQKNAAAVMLMQRTLELYSEKNAKEMDDALTEFASTAVYQALFDFETGLWKEGPEYILALWQREYHKESSN